MELEELYAELEEVSVMTEEEVCQKYNTDSKKDILDDIERDIKHLKALPESDNEMDYINLQLSQGMAAIYW